MSFNHWFIVARTAPAFEARLARDTGDAVMRVLARTRMMLVQNFMVTREEWVVERGLIVKLVCK
jgi:hypothetical protein